MKHGNEWLGGLGRAGFFTLLPAIAVGGALGVPILVGLAGLLSLPSLLQERGGRIPALVVPVGILLILAVSSSSWSQHASLVQALKLAVLIPLSFVFALAASQDPRLTRAGVIAAFCVLAVLLAIEALWGLPLNRAAQPEAEADELLRNVSRGASLLVAITWGAAGALLARVGVIWTVLGLIALAAAGFIALQFGQFANTIAYAAGLTAFAVALAAPRVAIMIAVSGLVLWLVLAPILTPLLAALLEPQNLPFSWNARIEIWNYICDRIWERPWLGHGLDAARAHMPNVPVHPHSASLQIWFEFGIVGVLITAALLITSGRQLVRSFGINRTAAAAAAGTLAAIGIIANVSYNFWAEWWIATPFVAGAAVGALGGGSSRHK